MSTLTKVPGMMDVEIYVIDGDVFVSQPGDQDEPDLIRIPLEHFWAFAEAVAEARKAVKQMGYR